MLAAGFLYYTANFPHIFDIGLYDESGYMNRGLSPGLLDFSNYEWNPLYSLFYRAVSLVAPDPLDVQLEGGLLILFAAFVSGALAVHLLSGNPVLAVLLAGLSLLMGSFVISPRVSFMAITLLGLGIPVALRFRRVSDKAALLAVLAFLLTFVRPEFITAFYLMLAIAAVAFLMRLWSRRTPASAGRPPLLADCALPLLCFAGLATLIFAWSLPWPAGYGRAFMAFGQHYAMRYAASQAPAVNSWQNWMPIMAREFPGARTVGDAWRLSPGKVLNFYWLNLADLIGLIWRTALAAVTYHPLFLGIGAVLLLGGAAWQRSARPASGTDSAAARHGLAADLLLIGAFALPPLLGCLLVYPRLHYVVMLEFVACLMLARALRGSASPLAPVFAVALGGVLLLSIHPLPRVAQPNIAIVRMLRGLPPMRSMVENDGGWCYYLPSRCHPYFLDGLTDAGELRDLLGKGAFDAVLVSPALRSYAGTHPGLGLGFLLSGGGHPGWVGYPLIPGYAIFYRRGG